MDYLDSVASISAIIIFFAIFFGILGLFVYIIEAVFSYKLYKMEEVENPWFAFIPLLSFYNIFEMIKKNEINFFSWFKLDKNTAMIIFFVLPFISSALFSGNLEAIAAILFVLYTFIIYYNLLNEWESPNAILYSILAIIISPLGIYLIYNERYKYRKNNNEIIGEYHEIKTEDMSIKETEAEKVTSEEQSVVAENN